MFSGWQQKLGINLLVWSPCFVFAAQIFEFIISQVLLLRWKPEVEQMFLLCDWPWVFPPTVEKEEKCAVKGMFCLLFLLLFFLSFFPLGGEGGGWVANSHVWEAKPNCNIMESVMRFLSVTLLYLFYHPFWHWCCLNNQFFDKPNLKKVWDCAIISARLASVVQPWPKL